MDHKNDEIETFDKLKTYKEVNKEMSKTLVHLKNELGKLKIENKELNKNCFKMENELLGWKNRYAQLKSIHLEHLNILGNELQTYALKLQEITNSHLHRDISEHSSQMNLNSNLTGVETSHRESQLFESPVQQSRSVIENSEVNSILHTINEESLEDPEASISNRNLEEDESSISNESLEEIVEANSEPMSLFTTTEEETIIANISNKENETPPSWTDSFADSINEENRSTKRFPQTTKPTLKKLSSQSLQNNDNFVTNRRRQLDVKGAENNSYKTMELSKVASSTPYKTRSTRNSFVMDTKKLSISSDSVSIVSAKTSIAPVDISTNSRPKRKVTPTVFIEPKLNTKMRRPRP